MVGGESFLGLWSDNWSNRRLRDALIFKDKKISYGELDAATLQVGSYLSDRFELDRSTTVAIMAKSCEAAVILNIALVRAGCTLVPVNPSLSLDELAHIVTTAKPKLFISFNAEISRYLKKRSDIEVADGEWLYQDAKKPSMCGVAAYGRSTESTTLIAFTSGTTAAPKGVPISNSSISWNLRTLAALWELNSEDSLYLSLPLFHIHGLVVGLYGALSVGASVYVEDRYSPAVLEQLLRSRDVNTFFGVPTMYHRLLVSGKADALSYARLVVSGSAPLSQVLFEDIFETSGKAVVERYGMTETLIISSNPYRGEKRRGSVGIPLPETNVSFTDEEEILISGPGVLSGYLAEDGQIEAAVSSSTPFATGDLGHMVDGYLYIDGRKKDLIITGGHNVHPFEVEEAISRISNVLEVAVVGKPSLEWGEEVTAFVVADGSLDEETVRRFVGGRLSPFKVPKSVVFVESLPKNVIGKLDRRTLKAQCFEGS